MKLSPTVQYFVTWLLIYFLIYLPTQFLIQKWATFAALKELVKFVGKGH